MNNHPPINSQIPLPLNLGTNASFDNFWVGHNSELVTAIKASIVAGGSGILYFYGPTGVGKSHLLFAAMRFAKEEVINSSYLSLENPLVKPELLQEVDVQHVVCIDNLQRWAGDELREQALFTLFEQIRHSHGQLLVSSSQAPERSGFSLADLVSRLASGLVYSIRELNHEQQFAAIKLRATNRGLSIPDKAVQYLLSRASRDTAELFDLLDKIDKASLIEKRNITIPFLQTLLKRQP